jgi:hypothetical protein
MAELKEYIVDLVWQTDASVRVKAISQEMAIDAALHPARSPDSFNTIERNEATMEVVQCIEGPFRPPALREGKGGKVQFLVTATVNGVEDIDSFSQRDIFIIRDIIGRKLTNRLPEEADRYDVDYLSDIKCEVRNLTLDIPIASDVEPSDKIFY